MFDHLESVQDRHTDAPGQALVHAWRITGTEHTYGDLAAGATGGLR